VMTKCLKTIRMVGQLSKLVLTTKHVNKICHKAIRHCKSLRADHITVGVSQGCLWLFQILLTTNFGEA
jgi:hypothetical protein